MQCPTIYSLMKDPGNKIRDSWRIKGIEIIPYDQHNELISFFEDFSKLAKRIKDLLKGKW